MSALSSVAETLLFIWEVIIIKAVGGAVPLKKVREVA